MSSSAVQLQKALAFLAAIDARDCDTLADLTHESFTHRFFPSSLGGFGKTVRTKQEVLEFVKTLEATFERFNFLPPKDVVQGKDVVVLHIVNDGKTISGKPYKNEYMFTFRFEGDKIVSVREFLDSKYVLKVFEDEAQAKVAG